MIRSRWDGLSDEQLSEALGTTFGFGRPIKRGADREYFIAMLDMVDQDADAAA